MLNHTYLLITFVRLFIDNNQSKKIGVAKKISNWCYSTPYFS